MKSQYTIWIYSEQTPRTLLDDVLRALDGFEIVGFEFSESVPGQVRCETRQGLNISVKPIVDLSNPWKNAGAEYGIKTNARIVISGDYPELGKINLLIKLINGFIREIDSDAMIESLVQGLLLKKEGVYQIPAETWEPEFLEQMVIEFTLVDEL